MTNAQSVVSFYHFTRLANPREFGETVRVKAASLKLLGTAIVAPEGLNATFCGASQALQDLLAWIGVQPGFEPLKGRWSQAAGTPFRRLRIKYRDEIVSMGFAHVNPADGQGEHVNAEQWHALLDDPNTLVIDTRNDYEIEIGSFPGAVNPRTTNFREFADFVARDVEADKDRPVAMFCTGGIRCEKATAVMRERGFSNLYQLDGGILTYLDEVAQTPSIESRWEGECFVFDARVAVDDSLTPGAYVQCHGCRRALSADDTTQPEYEPGICCARCFDTISDQQRVQFEERRRQVALADARGEAHIGAVYPDPVVKPENDQDSG
ncbi:MAG: rhodanese-related sulfurtransferase [Pseudomonadota bacterium]